MIYNFSHKNYQNFSVFRDNKLQARAYFVPFSSRAKCAEQNYLSERFHSDRKTILSGKWDFKYFPSVSELGESIDTDQISFEGINVPSCWQTTGYEPPFYVNAKYQFKCKPPYFPTDKIGKTPLFLSDENKNIGCAVGVYRKRIIMKKVSNKEILGFLGACSNIELYVNGKYIGYSEGSHNTAEFDIAEALQAGENEIMVLVYKFSNGTYLECQDMFRHNGIFRDVYLDSLGASYIWDYSVSTPFSEGKYSLGLSVTAVGGEVKATLVDEKKLSKVLVEGVIKSAGDYALAVQDVEEWSAENPRLYHLYLQLFVGGKEVECVRQEIGFKQVKIRGSVFLFNNKPIKIKGVNHHDSSPIGGFTMTVDEMVKDVELMKEFNVNGVRTSHYPPDPLFLKLANYYGLYIIDEADIETHGTYAAPPFKANLISNNKKWAFHFWDRVKSMYFRDRNNACITMWSLGNESGGWKCQDYCYAKLKKYTRIPVHYEAVVRTKRFAYDVTSEMYAPAVRFSQILSGKPQYKKFFGKPYFLCEYVHAMGVGPAQANDYWKGIYSDDRFMGGCVWEWCDHAIQNKAGSKYKYSYGGDNAEFIHDGNFCVDGLVYPSRTPHTGLYNIGTEYRPLRASFDEGKVTIKNTNYFTDSSKIKIEFKYLVGGKEVKKGAISEVILAGATLTTGLNFDIDKNSDCVVVFEYTNKETKRLVAKEQIVLNTAIKVDNVESDYTKLKLTENADVLGVQFANGYVAFSRERGEVQIYNKNGNEYVNQKPCGTQKIVGFSSNIVRAPFDNDRNIIRKWEKQGVYNNKYILTSMTAERCDEAVVIKTEHDVVLKGFVKANLMREYKIYSNGTIDLNFKLKLCSPFAISLPRFGALLEMPSEFSTVEYYGLGDKENYPDFKTHCVFGEYKLGVDEFEEPYIKPQESGSRGQVRWAKVINAKGSGLMFEAIENGFGFKTSNKTQENYLKATHQEDLTKRDTTCVYLDGFLYGVGSNSCGPQPLSKYKTELKGELEFAFRVKPL